MEESFEGFKDYGLVEVIGDDEIGRRIIVVSAYRLPPNKELLHDKLLRYLHTSCLLYKIDNIKKGFDRSLFLKHHKYLYDSLRNYY